MHCEVCKMPYRIIIVENVAWSWENICRAQPCLLLMEASLLLIVFIVMIVMIANLFVIFSIKDQDHTGDEVSLLVFLACSCVAALMGLVSVLQKWKAMTVVQAIESITSDECSPLFA